MPLDSFNPRTRVGCDILPVYPDETWQEFQSTHPRGVRRYACRIWWRCGRFQSTHPRGVRRHRRCGRLRAYSVSIHAPAWGATHPPPWCCRDRDGFNPRTRVGCDQTLSLHMPRVKMFQSTHPRGVRRFLRSYDSLHCCFNPRTRVGCDCACTCRMISSCMFQSTHPRGVRRNNIPRTPKWTSVSIHAPAWGATQGGVILQPTAPVSIHAPAWGATAAYSCSPWRAASFNPRTRVGCDRRFPVRILQGSRFNPRTRVGCDPLFFVKYRLYLICFNPRTRVGCDCFHVLSSRFP